MLILNPHKMPEAEVCLRLAFYLLQNKKVSGNVLIAIDGAQVQVGDVCHFPIQEFLATNECEKLESDNTQRWQGIYRNSQWEYSLEICSKSGLGDLVAPLKTGERLRVECKKGTLERSKSSAEYPLLREALGQLLTYEDELQEHDLFAVCVPESEKFLALANRWRQAPLVKKSGIQILTVNRDNQVMGFLS